MWLGKGEKHQQLSEKETMSPELPIPSDSQIRAESCLDPQTDPY